LAAVFTYEASEQGLSGFIPVFILILAGFILVLREAAKIDYTAVAIKGRRARSYMATATIEKSPQWHQAGVGYPPANERLM
jgi:hypothetical protein